MSTVSLFPKELWIFLIVSLACCSIGFKRFIWFMTVGYGLSSAGIGLTMFILSLVRHNFNVLFLIQALLFVIYGIRLGGFLLIREMKNVNYRKKLSEAGGDVQPPVFVAIMMWIIMGALYVCQSIAPIYRLLNKASNNLALVIGIIISLVGIVLEALADKQKSADKLKNPNMPSMDKLYKICRCPNYFGEILFWTGSLVSAIGAVYGMQWIFVIIGYILILMIMFSGAKRVEARHIKTYGDLQEYNDYADHTPLIIPLIPLYHMTSKEKISKQEEKKKNDESITRNY